jgi:hypothetical protein
LHFVGIANSQLQLVVLYRRDVAHADDLELLFKSARDSFDHIGQQRARQTVGRSSSPAFPLPRDHQRLAIFGHRRADLRYELARELAQFAFDLHSLTVDGDFDVTGDGDRFFSNAGHL